MRAVFAFLLAVHGFIHLMGFAKAFRLTEVRQIVEPVSRPAGVLWLLATALFLATTGAFFMWPRGFWAVGAAAIVVSQIAVFGAWRDAKWGTVANVFVLAGVALGFLSRGPYSMREEYRREVDRALARGGAPSLVTERDLALLPAPVARYLRVTGAVGQPSIESFRARFRGQMRTGPDAQWMPFTGEQHNFYGERARLFFMEGSRLGVPLQALHLYIGPSATMRVKVASLVPVVDARGAEMDQGETVTLFNDMCLLAPATLIDPSIRWEEVDARTARAVFTNAGHTVRAELSFDGEGFLTGFRSADRFRASPDGKSFALEEWSTPVSEYRTFGSRKAVARGEVHWGTGRDEFAYLLFDGVDVTYNVGARTSPAREGVAMFPGE